MSEYDEEIVYEVSRSRSRSRSFSGAVTLGYYPNPTITKQEGGRTGGAEENKRRDQTQRGEECYR